VSIHALPLLNAILNCSSGLLLTGGYGFIRRRMIRAHRVCMVAAFTCSVLFLASYLLYHAHVGSVRFEGQGALRAVYFTILISHTLLAAAVPPLAVLTLWRALHKRFARHRKIARWTLPIWLYVSMTGVAIYVLLYGLFQPS
jgi:uncharacterized membrane protein YozB (DUF420 family)